MKRFLLFATFVCATLFTSCEEYDDSALVNRLDGFENRLKKLEELCSQMNTNISSLQTIVNAIQKNDQISTIAPITKDGKEIGYTIIFTSGKNITIYHGSDGKDGADGKDGHTPKIGVKQDSDGNYYWTIDGEWLTDDNGNKIKANGTDGKDGANGTDGKDGQDGKDGITPQLKIENGYWYVSYDNGATWKQLGKATGENGADGKDGQNGTNGTNGQDGKDGDSFFQSVTQDDKNVYFTLADGTVITISKAIEKQEVALAYIPRYSDGKATVFYNTKENSYVEFDFEVSPASAAADWSEFATVKAVYTQTRAVVDFVEMEILDWTTDTDNGTITVKASGANLCDSFFDGGQEASARLVVEGDDINIISDYIPMVAEKTVPSDEIWYTSTDGEVITPNETDVFGANIVSNTYENGKGIIKFDGPITKIGYTAFNNSDRLTTIIIPDGVTEISAYAFNNCEELVQVEMPNSVTIIGDRAMSHLPKLISIVLPNQLKSIGANAFANCDIVTEIHIPDSVEELGASVLFNNDCLQKITGKLASDDNRFLIINNNVNSFAPAGITRCEIPQGVVSIGDDVFRGCNELTEIIIPSSVQSFGLRVFWGTQISTIEIPNGVTILPLALFDSCTSLKTIILPESIIEIGRSVFASCRELESITIPEGVQHIRSNAFGWCSKLTSIYCKPTIPTSVASDTFQYTPDELKVYVPVGSGEAYKSAEGWKDFADMIEEKEM